MPSLPQTSKQIGCDSIILNVERLKKMEKNGEKNGKKLKKKRWRPLISQFLTFWAQTISVYRHAGNALNGVPVASLGSGL